MTRDGGRWRVEEKAGGNWSRGLHMVHAWTNAERRRLPYLRSNGRKQKTRRPNENRRQTGINLTDLESTRPVTFTLHAVNMPHGLTSLERHGGEQKSMYRTHSAPLVFNVASTSFTRDSKHGGIPLGNTDPRAECTVYSKELKGFGWNYVKGVSNCEDLNTPFVLM